MSFLAHHAGLVIVVFRDRDIFGKATLVGKGISLSDGSLVGNFSEESGHQRVCSRVVRL